MFDIFLFRDSKGNCPILEELDKMPVQAQAKARTRIQRLAELGNELKRPDADYLRDGIYELRWHLGRVQYRILYFFSGKGIIILSHVITKEKDIPPKEIEKCLAN